MEILKEHKSFRNQMIFVTILSFSMVFGFGAYELIPLGIIMCIIAIYNIFSYRQNVKDYNKLKEHYEI